MNHKAQGWSYIGISAVLLALMLNAPHVSAGGGKVQAQNPVFDEDGGIVGVVDPNVECEKYASLQSGQTVYFCSSESEDD